MRLPLRLAVPDLLQKCTEVAPLWHIRLALTSAGGDTWLARSVVIDVFPQPWLDKPGNVFKEAGYAPPNFSHYFPDRALFLAGVMEAQVVRDWFIHPEDCELKRHDMSLHFRMLEVHPDVSGMRVNSKQPDGFAMLPWPHFDFRCNVKDASNAYPEDSDSLYARGQGHFDNLRDARAKLIHGETDLRNFQDQNEAQIRVIDGDGWIREVRHQGAMFDVLVGGLDLIPGYVILKRRGAEDEEQERTGPGSVTFDLKSPPDAQTVLDFVLTNNTGELDRARYVGAPSPGRGMSSAHVVIDTTLEDISAAAAPAGAPHSGSTAETTTPASLVLVQPRPISLFPSGPFTRNEQLCFVLMPFADELRLVYDDAIVPAATRAGLECQRADDILKPGSVMGQVWQALMEARVVIADLTNTNPNVFYELGLAHCIGHDAILLTQDKKWVPFDLQAMRWIKYGVDEHSLKLLRQKLGRALKAVLGETKGSGVDI